MDGTCKNHSCERCGGQARHLHHPDSLESHPIDVEKYQSLRIIFIQNGDAFEGCKGTCSGNQDHWRSEGSFLAYVPVCLSVFFILRRSVNTLLPGKFVGQDSLGNKYYLNESRIFGALALTTVTYF